jgi:hypothetical protein
MLPLVHYNYRLTTGTKNEGGHDKRRSKMEEALKATAAIISSIACSGPSTMLLTEPAAPT